MGRTICGFSGTEKTDSLLVDLSSQVASLNQVVDALKSYSEAIVKKIEDDPKVSDKLIKDVEADSATRMLSTNHLVTYVLRKNSGKMDIEQPITPEIASKFVKAALESENAAEFLSKALDDKKRSRLADLPAADRDFSNLKTRLSHLSLRSSPSNKPDGPTSKNTG